MLLDKNEVLRYLGYRGQKINPSIHQLIETCMEEVVDTSDVRTIAATFSLKREGLRMLLAEQVELKGKAIHKHFAHAKQCAVIAVTLGIQIDRLIREAQYRDMTKATILDACATAYVEANCDELNTRLSQAAEVQGIHLTTRFSPGYGDLPLTLQPELLQLLHAEQRIGLTVTDTCILIPRKSVTALIGRQDVKDTNLPSGCITCTQRDCAYCRNIQLD